MKVSRLETRTEVNADLMLKSHSLRACFRFKSSNKL